MKTDIQHSAREIALVTCSYGPDFERCAGLCASMDRFVDPDYEHFIVVPERDRARFSRLGSASRRIVSVQDILPGRFRQLPLADKWWLDGGHYPIRGWMVQQLTKLSADVLTRRENLLFIDSDIQFIRPFQPERFIRDGALRLHRKPGEKQQGVHLKWHHAAAELLGLTPRYFDCDYVSTLVSWRRSSLVGLKQRIEETTGRPWQQAVGRRLTVSEYILYGVFAEHVLGTGSAGHFPCTDDVCHSLWFARDTEDFLSRRDFLELPQAVHIQSNIGLSQRDVGALVDRVQQSLAVG
jgi:hypothetical protein